MRKQFVSLLIWGFAVCAASASYISLETSITSRVTGKNLAVLINIVNKGDESAFNVQPEVRVGERTIFAEKKPELGVNAKYSAMVELPLSVKVPGQYPLIVVLHYADANLYPFSAGKVQTFSYQGLEEPIVVFGKMSGDTFWQNGTMKADFKNLSNQDLDLKLTIISPQELTVGEYSRQLRLPARGNASQEYSLANFSALSGSTYQLFAIAEYDIAGRHQTQITPGLARLVEGNLYRDNQLLIYLLLTGLILVFVWLQYKKQ